MATRKTENPSNPVIITPHILRAPAHVRIRFSVYFIPQPAENHQIMANTFWISLIILPLLPKVKPVILKGIQKIPDTILQWPENAVARGLHRLSVLQSERWLMIWGRKGSWFEAKKLHSLLSLILVRGLSGVRFGLQSQEWLQDLLITSMITDQHWTT